MITGVPAPRPAFCGSLGAKLLCQVGSCLVCSGEMEANTSEGSCERGWCTALCRQREGHSEERAPRLALPKAMRHF